jgi:hypothetical protein
MASGGASASQTSRTDRPASSRPKALALETHVPEGRSRRQERVDNEVQRELAPDPVRFVPAIHEQGRRPVMRAPARRCTNISARVRWQHVLARRCIRRRAFQFGDQVLRRAFDLFSHRRPPEGIVRQMVKSVNAKAPEKNARPSFRWPGAVQTLKPKPRGRGLSGLSKDGTRPSWKP